MFTYPKKLDKIFEKLINNDASPIIIGGFVRDKILQIDSIDIDIEVYNINSFDRLEKLLKEFGSVNSVGKSFGVCKLDFDEFKLDFTLPRTDSKVSNGHTGFDIKIDANLDYKTASSRRDFSINTIGYDVKTKKILDPFNGIDNLKTKTLKVVDTHKFSEDPLRILRAMQFCARFELTPDVKLISICKEMCNKNILAELPKERIFEEFNKLFLKSSKPSIGLNFLKQIDALNFFYELNMDKKDWDFTLDAIDRCTKDMAIQLASLCYKIKNKDIEQFITKLTNNKNTTRYIKQYHHIAIFLKSHNTTLKYSIMKDIDLSKLTSFLKAINSNQENLKLIKKLKPIVNGKELVKVGFKPSKEFSNILQLIYEVQYLFHP
ncbi:MAG: CCA tRNA nucleotidyltransferase [Campylobacterota bacterium]|nr:CCA tRNA nucleotidyltransferase [Campylobacterota bacterium]